MRMPVLRWGVLLGFAGLLCAAVPPPSDWVPARWPWSDAKSLELLADSPINCLLLKAYSADFVAAAAQRGLVVLAVISTAGDAVAAAHKALAVGVTGIVLEGDFPNGTAAAIQRAAPGAPVIQLTARGRLPLGSQVPILGTYQGVWPGIEIEENGAIRAGPTGSTWINTNTGFLRAVRAWGDATLWIANEPPRKTIITGERYLQVIADAAISGARWVLALDDDFAARLNNRQAAAMRDWRRIANMARYFEEHPEWRRMREYGNVAVVQDPRKGGLLSGGVLDLMAAKHMPARPVPSRLLTAEAIRGVTITLNLDSGGLTATQEKALRDFASAGGTLLTGPPIWDDLSPTREQFTVSTDEFKRLNPLWNMLNSMLQRHNYGVRLFNVSSMISNVLVSADEKALVVHLVNYSDYPVEQVFIMFPEGYRKATLITPDGPARTLEISRNSEGSGMIVPTVPVCATVEVER
jgi:hypothetical protein